MATYVLIHGASSDSWYWHLVGPELQALGHDVVAPDLPTDDDNAGVPEYADAVVQAVGVKAVDASRTDIILVAQSLGGCVVPVVCQRLPVTGIVMVAAMVPTAGESPGDWWANTGWEHAREQQLKADDRPDGIDVMADFFHDVPSEVTAETFARGERYQSGAIFDRHFPMPPWPADVPTRFLLCRNDRFFPADFMRRVVRERLGIVPDEMESGHLPALAHPKDLVDRLESYRLDSSR